MLEIETIFKSNIHSSTSKIGMAANGDFFECQLIPIVEKKEVACTMVLLRFINDFERELLLLNMKEDLPDSIMNSTQIGIASLNMQFEITYTNQAFNHHLGYDNLQFVGTSLKNFIEDWSKNLIFK